MQQKMQETPASLMQICQIGDNIGKFDTMKIKMRKSRQDKVKKTANTTKDTGNT
jgi:hypothetical protein